MIFFDLLFKEENLMKSMKHTLLLCCAAVALLGLAQPALSSETLSDADCVKCHLDAVMSLTMVPHTMRWVAKIATLNMPPWVMTSFQNVVCATLQMRPLTTPLITVRAVTTHTTHSLSTLVP